MKSLHGTGPNLRTLVELFPDSAVLPKYTEIPANEVPQPYHRLLVHEHHMTVTVEAHHGHRAELRVLDSKRDGDRYARKILLVLGETENVVQFGIMRFNFEYCDDEVRDEILKGETPLGRILIEHNVLRRIEPTAFLRIIPDRAMMEWFKLEHPLPTYGRLAVIHCNNKPAVELLEIVAPEPTE